MTLWEALHFGRQRLQAAEVPDYEYDAGALLQYAADISMSQILGNPEGKINPETFEHYREMIGKREKRIPLQHIIGETCFYGYMFRTRENVLIPRSDTEHLVELALMRAPERPIRFLDLCTGSGCIGISFMLERRLKGFIDEGILTDISPYALSLARENAERLQAELTVLCSDLFEKLEGECFDLIMSNPPYISLEEMDGLMPEVREHDPRIALTDEADGLTFYRKIISGAPEHLAAGGRLIMEIGCDQRKDIEVMLTEMNYTEITCIRDLAGLDRVISAVGPLQPL